MELLRQLVNGGWSGVPTPEDSENTEFRLSYTNTDILSITKNNSLRNVIRSHHLKYIAHVCHYPISMLTRKMLFAEWKRPFQRHPWINIAKLLNVCIE